MYKDLFLYHEAEDISLVSNSLMDDDQSIEAVEAVNVHMTNFFKQMFNDEGHKMTVCDKGFFSLIRNVLYVLSSSWPCANPSLL